MAENEAPTAPWSRGGGAPHPHRESVRRWVLHAEDDAATPERLNEALDVIAACMDADWRIKRVLAEALGYPRYGDGDDNPPDDPGEFVVGDHTAETLAMEAAQRLLAVPSGERQRDGFVVATPGDDEPERQPGPPPWARVTVIVEPRTVVLDVGAKDGVFIGRQYRIDAPPYPVVKVTAGGDDWCYAHLFRTMADPQAMPLDPGLCGSTAFLVHSDSPSGGSETGGNHA